MARHSKMCTDRHVTVSCAPHYNGIRFAIVTANQRDPVCDHSQMSITFHIDTIAVAPNRTRCICIYTNTRTSCMREQQHSLIVSERLLSRCCRMAGCQRTPESSACPAGPHLHCEKHCTVIMTAARVQRQCSRAKRVCVCVCVCARLLPVRLQRVLLHRKRNGKQVQLCNRKWALRIALVIRGCLTWCRIFFVKPILYVCCMRFVFFLFCTRLVFVSYCSWVVYSCAAAEHRLWLYPQWVFENPQTYLTYIYYIYMGGSNIYVWIAFSALSLLLLLLLMVLWFRTYTTYTLRTDVHVLCTNVRLARVGRQIPCAYVCTHLYINNVHAHIATVIML